MDWASTPYVLAMLSMVSPALTVTTTPGTGGIRIWSPVEMESSLNRFEFDQRIWDTVTPNLEAIESRVSPACTVYVDGWWLIGAELGIATGLLSVLVDGRRRAGDRYGLDDRAVAAEGDVSSGPPFALHHRLGVHRAESGGQI